MAAASTLATPEATPRPGVVAGGAAMPLREAARRLVAYVRPERKPLIAGVLLFFAGGAIDPLLPALFKQLIDSGFGTRGGAGFPLWLAPVAIIGIFTLRGVVNFTASYLFARATSRAVLALRRDLATALLRADAELYTQISPGVAAHRVLNDPQNAIGAIAGALVTLLRDGTTLIALLGYMLYLDWQLTLVSLVTVPALALVVQRVQRRILAVSGRSYESQVRLTGIVDDIARAWRVVRSFDAAGFEQQRFGAEAERLRRVTLKVAAAGAAMTPLTQFVTACGVALIVTLALLNASQGAATVGSFVAFVTALLMTISPLKHLSDLSQPLIGGLVVARACFALIDTPPEADTGTAELPAAQPGTGGELRFENVTVAYPGSERPALDGVSFTVPAGGTLAVVGASGAGKSTLVNTLLGFVAPRLGQVLIDGVPIGTLRKGALRRQFAVVSQDTVLFDGSIEDNVIYALPRDPGRARACLEAADLGAFVATLPEGAATGVGINGSRLSGGQRQRLAIARALYKDARLWIFDEATSALDSESERAVHDAIERWRGRRTLILIAHRLSTVRHADRIVVLAGGRVVETGDHDTLMARGGAYAGMVRLQSVA